METNTFTVLFFLNSILLGVGLAMDAFSVSLADGLGEPNMPRKRMALIAGTFAFFQALMPLAGWLAVHTVLQVFSALQGVIPWVAFALLAWIGVHMWLEKNDGEEEQHVSRSGLLLQGIATSIDALSVGFTIAEYSAVMALVCAVLIAAVTFVICMGGLLIGRKTGTKLAGSANKFGGTILILIGLEILLEHLFF
ncbi:MAG: manganese efflux pump [Solobacterium sp.]|nr:manganese efflux pump [Solobacterium sp.]